MLLPLKVNNTLGLLADGLFTLFIKCVFSGGEHTVLGKTDKPITIIVDKVVSVKVSASAYINTCPLTYFIIASFNDDLVDIGPSLP